MCTLDRILKLIRENGINAAKLTKEIGLSHSAVSDWKKGKGNPSAKTIAKIADYFNVSADYLLCKTDDPTPPGNELIIPDELKDVKVAFHRGEFEDLTQDEVDTLAVIAKRLKEQRLKGNDKT